jgi:hypothetical protein
MAMVVAVAASLPTQLQLAPISRNAPPLPSPLLRAPPAHPGLCAEKGGALCSLDPKWTELADLHPEIKGMQDFFTQLQAALNFKEYEPKPLTQQASWLAVEVRRRRAAMCRAHSIVNRCSSNPR